MNGAQWACKNICNLTMIRQACKAFVIKRFLRKGAVTQSLHALAFEYMKVELNILSFVVQPPLTSPQVESQPSNHSLFKASRTYRLQIQKVTRYLLCHWYTCFDHVPDHGLQKTTHHDMNIGTCTQQQ